MRAQERWRVDGVLLGAVTILYGIGLVMLYSLDHVRGGSFFWRQVFWGSIGIGIGYMVSMVDLRSIVVQLARWAYFFSVAALIAVLIFGVNVRGTVGWLSLGPVSIQVVEIVKVAMIVFLAGFLSAKQTVFGPYGRLMISLTLTTIIVGLILLQPDFGSAMVVLSIWAGMLFASGMRRTHVVGIILGAVIAAAIGWTVLAEYQRERVLTFVDPYRDPRGSGYNVIQAMTAIGSGGVFGKGLGNGTQVQFGFVPEAHTDFIFAAIAEEIGMVGALAVVILYAIVLWRIWRIAHTSHSNIGYLIGSGVMVMIFVHSVINIGMNLGVMPVTGIPLPFISYGGSALVANMVAIALMLALYRRQT